MAEINIKARDVVVACGRWQLNNQRLDILRHKRSEVQIIEDLATYCQQEFMTIDHNDYSLIGDYLPI